MKAQQNIKSGKNPLRRFIKNDLSAWLLLIPSIILFYYIVWRPIGVAFGFSMFKLRGFTPTEFVWFKNYADVMSDTDFLKTLANSFMYVFWALIIAFPLPFFVAVLLNEMIHLKGFYKIAVYLPAVIPPIAVYMIWTLMYLPGQSGVFNIIISHLGGTPLNWLQNEKYTIPLMIIASAWHSFGSNTILYLAGLQSINNELYEACKIEGAGLRTRFRVVLLPHMAGTIMLLLVRQIIRVFQILEMPLVMTGGGPNRASLSMALQSYKYAFEYGQMDKGLASGVIIFFILIALTFVYMKVEKKFSE